MRQLSVRCGTSLIRFATLCVLASYGALAVAVEVTFTKIADKATAIPDWSGSPAVTTFQAFGNQAIDGNAIAFHGTGFNALDGVYLYRNGGLSRVADRSTVVPNSAGQPAGLGTFTLFQEALGLTNGAVTFRGFDGNGQGALYTNLGGTLHLIASPSTSVPDESGNSTAATFSGGVCCITSSDNTIIFRGFGGPGGLGLYSYAGPGTLRAIATRATTTPVSFQNSGFEDPNLRNGVLAFKGTSNGLVGILTLSSGTYQSIATLQTAAPGGSSNFSNVSRPEPDGANVVFLGFEPNGNRGVFAYVNGVLRRVADKNTPLLGGFSTIFGFNRALISGDIIAFDVQRTTGGNAVYAEIAGTELVKLLAPGDQLDGRSVNSASLSAQSFSSGQLAISVQFVEEDWRTLYLASFDAPSDRPVANAGPDRAGPVGAQMPLDGGLSSDDETPPSALTASWSIVSRPSGSTAEIADSNSLITSFTPDLPGSYVISLVVTDQDGQSSASDTVNIDAEIIPAFVYERVFEGAISHRFDANTYEEARTYFDATAPTTSFVLGTLHEYAYTYDRIDGNWLYTSSDALAHASNGAAQRVVSRGDIDPVSGDTFDWFSHANESEAGIIAEAQTHDPGGQFHYGAWLFSASGPTPLARSPIAVSGESRVLTVVWTAPRALPGSIVLGSDESCTNINVNGFLHCYWQNGIYLIEGGLARKLVASGDSAPDGLGTFVSFGDVAADEMGNIAFVGHWTDSSSKWISGLFRKLVGGPVEFLTQDLIDLKSLKRGYAYNLRIDNEIPYFEGVRFLDDNPTDWWGSAEQGVFSVRDGVVRAEATAGRAFSWIGNYDVRDQVITYQGHQWSNQGQQIHGVFWLEDSVVRSVAIGGDTILGRSYERFWPSWSNAIAGRSTVVTGYTSVSNSYDPLTGFGSSQSAYDVLRARFDTDRDGIADDSDNCRFRPNVDQYDSDGNDVGDVCEDTDADTVPDTFDNCPFFANASQLDVDGDDVGDECDACPAEADGAAGDLDGDSVGDSCDADLDGDGHFNTADNCPFIPNALQENLDYDSLGDACDRDKDGDGIVNEIDGRVDSSGNYLDESAIFSEFFSDQRLGGRSFGQILQRANLAILIEDDADGTEGVRLAAVSGTGRGRVRQCPGTAQAVATRFYQGSIVTLTCGSVSLKTLANRVDLEIGADAIIDVPQYGSATLVESTGLGFALANPPEGNLPLRMALADGAIVTLPTATTVLLEQPLPGQYELLSPTSSAQPFSVTKNGFTVSYAPGDIGVPVKINIKPDSAANTIKIGSGGVYPTAVLSSASFDATRIEPLSVTLASAPVKLTGQGKPIYSLKDVDGDGRTDILLQIETKAAIVDSSIAVLRGITKDGVAIIGSDKVKIVN